MSGVTRCDGLNVILPQRTPALFCADVIQSDNVVQVDVRGADAQATEAAAETHRRKGKIR
jgi:hypothetical protein